MNSDIIRIGVISDTHGLLRPEVIKELESCTHILHAGDVVKEIILDELRTMGSIYAVRGNCDYMAGITSLQGLLRFEIGGVKFVMVHDPHDVPRDLTGVQVVVTGHTHRYLEERKDDRLWLNPGSCGPSRYGEKVTMAILTLRGGKVDTVRRIDLG